jgi:hypothetical protein
MYTAAAYVRLPTDFVRDTRMFWFIMSAVTGLIFAAVAVPVRRRFGTGAHARFAAGTAACVLAVWGAVIVRAPPRDGVGFGLFIVIAAAITATAVSAIAIERLVASSTIPDVLPEIAAGVVAFVGGAVAGALAGVMLVALSVPRIG